jgi:phosphoglycerate dehydrogenase-like enzyme
LTLDRKGEIKRNNPSRPGLKRSITDKFYKLIQAITTILAKQGKGGEMANIETVGIVGFGVMGAAIGLNAASSGYRVIYKELNDELVRTHV